MSRSRPVVGKRRTTKEYRAARKRRCADYLMRAGNLQAARALARADGFSADTSAWIMALGDILAKHGPRSGQ